MYALSEEVRTALLNYLSQKPWGEVNQAMQVLLALKPIDQPPLGTAGDTPQA